MKYFVIIIAFFKIPLLSISQEHIFEYHSKNNSPLFADKSERLIDVKSIFTEEELNITRVFMMGEAHPYIENMKIQFNLFKALHQNGSVNTLVMEGGVAMEYVFNHFIKSGGETFIYPDGTYMLDYRDDFKFLYSITDYYNELPEEGKFKIKFFDNIQSFKTAATILLLIDEDNQEIKEGIWSQEIENIANLNLTNIWGEEPFFNSMDKVYNDYINNPNFYKNNILVNANLLESLMNEFAITKETYVKYLETGDDYYWTYARDELLKKRIAKYIRADENNKIYMQYGMLHTDPNMQGDTISVGSFLAQAMPDEVVAMEMVYRKGYYKTRDADFEKIMPADHTMFRIGGKDTPFPDDNYDYLLYTNTKIDRKLMSFYKNNNGW